MVHTFSRGFAALEHEPVKSVKMKVETRSGYSGGSLHLQKTTKPDTQRQTRGFLLLLRIRTERTTF